ncbi:MAG: dTDP-4-dehydrorhamnose 3,5-epimerase family protein [Deltaproteobacteria bacterium]|nr:dTDP-4-dehydrorhamnose 3,5-epimerase family protein [Deltaproteobacteria bacterium]
MSVAIADRLDVNMTIFGVEIKQLNTFRDERGFFREIVRNSDPFFKDCDFGQWSHSKMQKSVVKAWHYHHVQIDWWYVAIGEIQVVLFDNRPESPTFKNKMVFKLGETELYGSETLEACVKIPPGVLHGCKVLSEQAHLFYITSMTYDPGEEGRIPYDSTLVGYDWGRDAIVADNDKRDIKPVSTRIPVF